MTLPNGPYAVYFDAKLPPIIVEVQYGWVWQVGEPDYRPLSSYKNGRFVRLVEQPEPDEPPHGYFPGRPYPPVATPIASDTDSQIQG